MISLKYLFSFLLIFLIPSQLGAAWRTLANGFEYEARLEGNAHVVRFDPKKSHLDLLLAGDYGASALTAKDYRDRSGAVLVVNGGFFAPGFRPLGLLHRRGKTLQVPREVAWGILAVSGQHARILARKDWRSDGVTLALQVGPRLVVDGAIPTFKESGPARRSAVGITTDGKVEIAVSEKPLLLSEWAALMRKDCPNALNLDGGGSTQIAARLPNWSLNVDGLTAVPDALAVFGP